MSGRYEDAEQRAFILPDGRQITYVAPRICPLPRAMGVAALVKTRPSERLDGLATRTLGDPLAFWWLCDANAALDPFVLLDEVDPVIVPAPGAS